MKGQNWTQSLVLTLSLGLGVFSVSVLTQAEESVQQRQSLSPKTPARQRDLQVSTEQSTLCNPNFCTYKVKNWSKNIWDLITEANIRTFNDNFPADPDIVIRPNNNSEIYIQLKGKAAGLRPEYLNQLRHLDVLDPMERKLLEIKLSIVIYTMELLDADNFMLGISNKMASRPHPKAELSVGGTNSLSLGIPVNIWEFLNSVVGLNLDMSRVHSRSEKTKRFEFFATNGNSIAANGVSKIRLNPEGSGPTGLEKKDTGMGLGGTVTVNRAGTKVSIKDFQLRYAIPIEDHHYISEDTMVRREDLEISLNKLKVLWQRTDTEDLNSKDRNLIISANNVEKGSKLLNIITITATLEDELAENDQESGSSPE